MEIILTLLSVLVGVIGIYYAYRFNKEKQSKLSNTGDEISSLLSIFPLWLSKIIIVSLAIIPLIGVILMWLQKLGFIS
ncbi:hypothetical protein [Fredinandcohnia quinoae]|uniref:Uncharacterized protein n=1 Tax=Fredinandcohnia quinoae TaxID=2918902 RepID=A0AAW5E3F6_9BACI|nr:hypothetical protein [Fredinandcohnia sp. SECRCQ15]MCH1627038.1 hypothetical protein [Fredinandcohnia sp. SECRCQ15]